MIDEQLFDRIARRIDAYEKDMVSLQIELTAIPAIAPESGGDGEMKKAIFLGDVLTCLGMTDLEIIDAPDERVSSGRRPNIIVRYPGPAASSTEQTWIISHMDIVPPGEPGLWRHDPYHAYVQDGYIIGRGVVDNQQDLVASLYALKACYDEGLQPARTPGLVFVSDEETASRWGLAYLLRHEQNPFRKTDVICVPDSGNEEGTLLEIAEKSILWVHFRTLGKQCHGSKPYQGINAFLAASHLAVRLYAALHERFPASNPLFDPPLSTFEPTRKDANVPNVNTIPGEDNFYMDCRVLPLYDLSKVKQVMREVAEAIEKEFGVAIGISSAQEVQAPEATDPQSPIVTFLKQAIDRVYRVQATPQGIGAGTVAAYLRREGYPVAVWCRTTPTAHQPNENCLIANMMGNAKVFAHLFLQK